ncbi:inovirus-type Gp2 protein [Aeromonas veronii]
MHHGHCTYYLNSRNTVSLQRYVNGLFQRYSRLLVLRVDLSYKREHRDSLSLDEIIKHKDALLKNRRKGALAANWVGYACRLEFAPETGYHFHLVVFLNGANFRSDVCHAGFIIEEWKYITGGRGRGFNCNMKAKANEYRFCGIGVVNHHDKEKRQYLHKALAYLTKSDRVAKLKLDGRRTFFKGTLPKKVTARGRPRTKTIRQPLQPFRQQCLVGV